MTTDPQKNPQGWNFAVKQTQNPYHIQQETDPNAFVPKVDHPEGVNAFAAMQQHGAGLMTSQPQAQPQQQHPAQSMMATTQMSMTFPAAPQMHPPQQMHPITLQNPQPV